LDADQLDHHVRKRQQDLQNAHTQFICDIYSRFQP